MKRRWATLLIAAGIAGLAAPVRALPAYSILTESGSVMYTDLPDLNSTYLVFQVTKNSAGSDATVWAQLDTGGGNITNVGTGQHQIRFDMSTGAHGSTPATDAGFDQGETKAVYFLVKAGATSNTPQNLTVNLFTTCSDTSAPGCANGTLSGSLATAVFPFTVESTIQANANKVNTVITIPDNPTIGQLGKITVTGCTGTVGAAKVLYFSPVSDDSWPADAFEFIDSDIQIDNYAGSPYRGTALIPNGDVLVADHCYDEIFTFVINGVGTASTTPANFISSGQQIKHTTNSSGSFSVSIPPPGCPTITVSSTPAPLPDVLPDGGTSYSVTFSASPAPKGTYSFSSTALPSWLSLDPTTGVLSGTPPFLAPGSVSFTVTATDSGGEPAGCTGQAQFEFTVLCPTIFVESIPGVIPNATPGQPFSAQFVSALILPDWSAVNLPSWLTLNPVTGVLSGTPTDGDIGPVTFTVFATDPDTQCQGQEQISFAVDPAPAQIPTLGGAGLALLALSLAGAAFLMIRR